jgi:hypothetical protein
MNRIAVVAISFLLCAGLLAAGCGAKKEASSSAAIEKSQAMATIQQKADYLIGQAKAFYNSKQYNDAVTLAQYVLSRVDSNSSAAKSLLERAKNELAAQAKAKMEEMKKKFSFGK